MTTIRNDRERINTVIFDLFGTLVPYIGEAEFRDSLILTAKILGVKTKQLEDVLCTDINFVDWCTTSKTTFDRMVAVTKKIEA